MPTKEEIINCKLNSQRYIILLAMLEKAYKEKRITKKEKEKKEKKINFIHSYNHLKLNPFIKENSLLREIAISFFKTDYLAQIRNI